MPGEPHVSYSVEQLERELAELETRRQALLQDRRLYWRLGFSRERLNLHLRQTEARKTQCEASLNAARKAERANLVPRPTRDSALGARPV